MALYCRISKNLGKFQLDVEFQSEDEIVALMGASGCGKSMTLKCIAGIEKPDSGLIIINGVTVFDSHKKINLPPQKRKVGYLFQDYALFPNMTVRKNILTVLPKEKRGQIQDVLQAFQLEAVANQYPAQLSGGQKQRCALARMMVTEPEIIMLDEPFSALDSFLKWQMEQEVVTVLKNCTKPVLFVSHDRDEVYRICSKVVVIDGGINEPILSKQELYQHPHTYADALLTGCKNIIPVEDLGREIQLPGHGITLNKPEGAHQIGYLGIRAKQILPAHGLKAGQSAITFPYRILDCTEGVFSMILMVGIEPSEDCRVDSGLVLRWEIPKGEYQDLKNHPKILAIPEEDILLLRK